MGERHRRKRAFVKERMREAHEEYRRGDINYIGLASREIMAVEDAEIVEELGDAIKKLEKQHGREEV